MSPCVSVIIPTFNEAHCLRQAVTSLEPRDGLEVIVADGGSTDSTIAVARDVADQVVTAPRGRASQLNAGARLARGSVLLFLHADARLAPGSMSALGVALRGAAIVGGAFALRVESERRSLRVISACINLRSRWLRMPYGDQGLFVRAATFRSLGGFRSLEIMEDVDFVTRLRRCGKLALVRPALHTSDRRWRANGVLRTTAVNLTAALLYRLSVDPRRIRRLYDSLLVSGRQVAS